MNYVKEARRKHRVARFYERKAAEPSDHPQEVVRIVVFGATGVGKSSLCNLLCNKSEAFEVNDGFDSCTQITKSVSFKHNIDDKEIKFEVIDCPGFFDTAYVLDKINKIEAFKKNIEKCLYLTKNGVSAFLLTVPYGRLLPEYLKSIKFMKDYFHQSAAEHIVFVFTKSRGVSEDDILKTMKRQNENSKATKFVLNYLESINEQCVSSECITNNRNNLKNNRDRILNKIHRIHQQKGRFYGDVMWKAFKEQERKIRNVRNKYYAVGIAASVGVVYALSIGHKYAKIKKQNELLSLQNLQLSIENTGVSLVMDAAEFVANTAIQTMMAFDKEYQDHVNKNETNQKSNPYQ